eukprot:317680_1
MEYWWYIFIAISITIFIAITPFILYYFYQFYKWRNVDVVSKRRPQLVIAFSIFSLVNILFIRTYFAILSNLTYSGHSLGLLNDPRIRTPAIWFTQLTANLLLFRIWIVFYDWRRAVYLLQLKWSKQLLSNQDQHWTIKYGNILGNDKLLIIISIIHYISGVIITLITIEVTGGENNIYYDLIILLDALIIVIPFCILSFVSQKFHDNIGIRDEIRGVAIMIGIGLFGLIIGAIISKDTIIRSQGSYALTAVVQLCIVLRLLYVKQLQIYVNTNINKNAALRMRSVSVANKDEKKAHFDDVLKSEEGFKIFANHLLKEYSVETLLFLLELTQIKTAIISHYRELFASHNSKQYSFIQQDIEKAIDAMSYKINIAPQILKLSENVYKNVTIDKVINLWKYLYNQYIDISANSSINISHAVRMTILSQLNKHNLLASNYNIMININDVSKTKSELNIPSAVTNMHNIPSVSTLRLDVSEQASEDGSVNNSKDNSVQVSMGSYKLESHAIIMELITAFDLAAKEIHTLLETDSWQRFKITNEFKLWKLQFFDQAEKKRTFTIT